MSNISIFKETRTTTPEKHISFDQYLDDIQNGEYQYEVLAYRTGKLEKKALKCATPSGTFSARRGNGLIEHSGFICIDIDAKDQLTTNHKELKSQIAADSYTYAIHDSVSGNGGLVVYVKINTQKHLESFLSLEKHYLDTYKVIIDKSCKNVDRLRYVSFDPEMVINRKAKTWRTYLRNAQVEPTRHSYIFTNGDLDHIFEQIISKGIDLTNDYHDWYRIGGALQNYYGGQKGLDLFHQVSQMSPKYSPEAVDSLYKIIEKRSAEKIATIGTFLWMCSNAGIDIKTKRTESIERIAKMRRKAIGTSGGSKNDIDAKESARKTAAFDGFEGEDVETIISKVWELPESDLNVKSDDILADLKSFLRGFDIKFNEITRNYELDGEPMTDRDYNSLYIKAVEQVDEKITKDRLFSLIDSEYTPSYNPFTSFINKYKHLRPEGNFEKLCRAIKYRQTAFIDGDEREIFDYLELFLKKWLLGIISSMHGTYSILILVLTGGQRAGKTKFFRSLLPDELMSFYAESKLDEGKDSEILMTKKLIILDDEFGGKSKQDAKRLKELSSKQWFNLRRPFGRTSEDLRRLAVLAGTSNDDEVINDPTGNRRVVPVNIIDIDHELMSEIDKIDLFIELYHEWVSDKDKFMLTAGEIEMLNKCTELNEQPSPEEEMISKYFQVPSNEWESQYFTNTEIRAYIEERSPTMRMNAFKMGNILKKLGFRRIRKKINGATQTVYPVKVA